MGARFEVFKGRNRKWFIRLKAGNSRTFIDGQGYTRASDAKRGCRRVQAVIRGGRKPLPIIVLPSR